MCHLAHSVVEDALRPIWVRNGGEHDLPLLVLDFNSDKEERDRPLQVVAQRLGYINATAFYALYHQQLLQAS